MSFQHQYFSRRRQPVLLRGPDTIITTLDALPLRRIPKPGRHVVSQLFGTTISLLLTDNDGVSYTVSQVGRIASGIDHQTVGGGTFFLLVPPIRLLALPPDPMRALPVVAPQQYPHHVYYASQIIGDAAMALIRTAA